MAVRRRNRTWSITLELGFDPITGKRLRDYFTFEGTKKEAVAEEARLLREREEGTYARPSKLSVEQFLLDYWLVKVKNETAPRTEEGYRQIAEGHIIPDFGKVQLDKIRPLHIQQYLNRKRTPESESGKKPLSGQTVKHHYSVLRQMFNFAVQLRLLAINPVLSVSPPKADVKEQQVLDERQTAQLLNAAKGTELFVPLSIAAYTGVRRGELLGAMWKDVSWEAKTLSVVRTLQRSEDGFRWGQPKSRKSKRTIALSPSLMTILSQHKRDQAKRKLRKGGEYQDNDLICAREDGQPWDPSNLSFAFREFQDSLDLPRIRLHDLRHGHCTHLLKANMPLKLVSDRMGHSTIAITGDLYGHVLEGQDRLAATVLDEVMKKAFAQVRQAAE
jgi:integrase